MVSSATTAGINSNGPATARVPCLFSSGSAFFWGEALFKIQCPALSGTRRASCHVPGPVSTRRRGPIVTPSPFTGSLAPEVTIPTNLVTALVVITKS